MISQPSISGLAVNGRLTLTTAVPVTTADVTAATTLYFTPYGGNRCPVADANGNLIDHTFSEISIAVPAVASQMYDVWVYDNAGVLALELLAWTSDATRATALTTSNGFYVKTGAITRRYLGSFRTTTVAGQTEDSAAKRYVWNYYNRVATPAAVITATASWTYTTAAYRQANASATNQLDIVVGVAEDAIEAKLAVTALNNTAGGGVNLQIAIGYDSTTTPATNCLTGYETSDTTASYATHLFSSLDHVPAAGRHTYVWLEYSSAVGVTTWSGTTSNSQAGISAMWRR